MRVEENNKSWLPSTALVTRVAGAGLIHIGSAAVSLLGAILLARWMEEGEFGRYAFSIATATCLAGIASMGLPTTVLRFLPQYSSAGDSARANGVAIYGWRWTVLGGVAVAAAGLVLAAIADWYSFVEFDMSLLAGLGLIPVVAIGCYQMELARAAGLLAFALLPYRVVAPFLLVASCYLFHTWGRDLNANFVVTSYALLLTAMLVAQAFAIGSVGLFRHAQHKVSSADKATWTEVARPLWLQSFSSTLLRTADVIVLGIFLLPREVGIYYAATRFAALVGFMLYAVNMVIAPKIPELYYSGKREQLARLIRRATSLSFWPSAVVCLVLFTYAKPILAIYGQGYTSGANVLRILLIGQLVNSATGPVGFLMNLTGQHRTYAKTYGIAAAAQVGLGVPLVAWAGAEGAAIATCAAVVLWNFTIAWQAAKLTGVSPVLLPFAVTASATDANKREAA